MSLNIEKLIAECYIRKERQWKKRASGVLTFAATPSKRIPLWPEEFLFPKIKSMSEKQGTLTRRFIRRKRRKK